MVSALYLRNTSLMGKFLEGFPNPLIFQEMIFIREYPHPSAHLESGYLFRILLSDFLPLTLTRNWSLIPNHIKTAFSTKFYSANSLPGEFNEVLYFSLSIIRRAFINYNFPNCNKNNNFSSSPLYFQTCIVLLAYYIYLSNAKVEMRRIQQKLNSKSCCWLIFSFLCLLIHKSSGSYYALTIGCNKNKIVKPVAGWSSRFYSFHFTRVVEALTAIYQVPMPHFCLSFGAVLSNSVLEFRLGFT